MVQIIAAEARYFDSAWETLNAVMREGKFLAAAEAPPREHVKALWAYYQIENWPLLFALDTDCDRVVGWCEAAMCGDRMCNMSVGLLPEYRAQTLGAQLVSRMLERARAAGFARVLLDVRASNTRAIALYQRLGFAVTRVKRDVPLSGGCEDVLRMERALTQADAGKNKQGAREQRAE